MHAPRCVRSLLLLPVLAAFGLVACGTTAKEPSRDASSAPISPQVANYPSVAAEASPAETTRPSVAPNSGNSPGEAVAGSREDERSKSDRGRGLDAEGSVAIEETAHAKPKVSGSAARKEAAARPAPAAAPAAGPQLSFAEPPQLREAIVEFDNAFEQLSTSRACEDACRAFASMQRAAQRICNLVISNDPRERCRNARSRLDDAAKDLTPKCNCS